MRTLTMTMHLIQKNQSQKNGPEENVKCLYCDDKPSSDNPRILTLYHREVIVPTSGVLAKY